MLKREKIIVSLSGLCIVYGIFHFFFSSSTSGYPKAAADAIAPLDIFVTDITAQIMKTNLSKSEKYVLNLKNTAWPDPFFSEDEVVLSKEPEAIDNLPVYSGFLAMGARLFAVLDNMEYEVGETVLPYGHTIMKITPNHVVIARPGQAEIIIPLTEIE